MELRKSICALPLALALLAAAMNFFHGFRAQFDQKGYQQIVMIHLGYNATSQQLSEYQKTELLLHCVSLTEHGKEVYRGASKSV
jgi:hypothetical protein